MREGKEEEEKLLERFTARYKKEREVEELDRILRGTPAMCTEAKVIPGEILKVLPQIIPVGSAVVQQPPLPGRVQRTNWSDRTGY
ncbi:hypothetical protein Pmani_010171 [Petrolisthes manimaculis]|uniref:Uncharacterized protein n=1 Tax=Petrolisthes manimaculis TaxID=1843537 RepID=A0AAE1Q221_9EUCA|nr:hypothetical protein Pmani_010171 [Petrolisthes manimaculis]